MYKISNRFFMMKSGRYVSLLITGLLLLASCIQSRGQMQMNAIEKESTLNQNRNQTDSLDVFGNINLFEPVDGRWSNEKINAWYEKLPWLVGCNYIPHTAINQIEMWQASTWDPETIDKELGWAASIGMNTLRVYLHDLVYSSDKEGLYARMDQFLTICKKHGIRPFFVFFDDCHYPDPKLGPQPLPVKRWHNSGWVNCPSRDLAIRFAEGTATNDEVDHLRGYIQEIMTRFKDDDRILLWELYNEPGRGNALEGGNARIGDQSNRLVMASWIWARSVNPSQPIMSTTYGALGDKNIAINRINSDLHSIHPYGGPDYLEEKILEYRNDNRPIIVTEWLARTNGSTVEDCLPMMKKYNVGAVNWGFVSGKTGTVWPWSSRKDANGNNLNLEEKRKNGEVIYPGDPFPEPDIWFHDLFRADGTAYDPKEIEIFKKLTGKSSE